MVRSVSCLNSLLHGRDLIAIHYMKSILMQHADLSPATTALPRQTSVIDQFWHHDAQNVSCEGEAKLEAASCQLPIVQRAAWVLVMCP